VSDAPLRAPDLIEPILGWRCWRVVPDPATGRARLASVYHEALWPTRSELTASCRRYRLRRRPPWLAMSTHEAPDDRCTCGIYAATTAAGALPYLDVYPWQRQPGAGAALGLVWLWGTVVHCERGWRATHAYPLQVFVVAATPDDTIRRGVRDLAEYGAPVELLVTAPSGVLAELEARRLPLELPSTPVAAA
jgi:hypothetical protein